MSNFCRPFLRDSLVFLQLREGEGGGSASRFYLPDRFKLRTIYLGLNIILLTGKFLRSLGFSFGKIFNNNLLKKQG